MFKSLQINIPTNLRHTMDPKFIFVLFLVEVGSLIFNSLHMAASELYVYSIYNEMPIIYSIPPRTYSCFSNVNYCIYENRQLRFLKGLDVIFISLIVICYGSLFLIILQNWEHRKIRSNFRITWYTAFELLVLLLIALHTLLMTIIFERDSVTTNQCNRQNRLVRAENLFNYIVVCVLEVAYIGFDLVNRQASANYTPTQEFEYTTQPSAPLRLPPPPSENNRRFPRIWNS